jgi:hypothetical protein
VTKAILVAQFLRARAWWRLDSAGASALHVARSVVSLLDAAGYAQGLPDDDSGITALDAAGCFTGGILDPGPEGWTIVREWQLADEASAGPEDLLAQLARAASHDGPAASHDGPAASHDGPAAHLASLAGPAAKPITIPRQAGPREGLRDGPGEGLRDGRVTERDPVPGTTGSRNAT